MKIDWITVGAQILNFVILVLLLRHFLYRRILDAIDRRQKEIASRLQEAHRKQKEAEEEADQYRRERRALEEKRAQLVGDARKEAERTRNRMLEDAREEVEQERARWHRGLTRHQEAMLDRVRDQARAATATAVRRALSDLADEELERRVVEHFRRRLKQAAADDAVRAAIADSKQAVVRTAFDLDEDQRTSLRSLLAKEFDLDREPKFERAPELVVGIRIQAGEHVIGWSAEDYMTALTEEVDRLLRSEKAAGERRSESTENRGEASGDRRHDTPDRRAGADRDESDE